MKKKIMNDYIVNNKLDLDLVIDDYTPYITKVINNMVGNNLTREDKEEIIIDTFFELWKNFNNNKQINALDAYLAGIARNITKNKLKKNNVSVNIEDIEMLAKYSCYDNENDNSQINILLKSIKKLDETSKQIINLYYYSSKPIKEIASIMNMSETNIKIRLFRIRKKLNKEIERGECYE